MSAKFELDNGKLKEYPTWWTDLGSEGCYPEKPYHTKCGLSFKEKEDACDHLDCAVDAAKEETIRNVGMYCLFSFMMIVGVWYEKGDILAAVREEYGFFIIFGFIYILISIPPARQWLELREYKNHGTIHGRKAHRQ